jgi:hypothetical protein
VVGLDPPPQQSLPFLLKRLMLRSLCPRLRLLSLPFIQPLYRDLLPSSQCTGESISSIILRTTGLRSVQSGISPTIRLPPARLIRSLRFAVTDSRTTRRRSKSSSIAPLKLIHPSSSSTLITIMDPQMLNPCTGSNMMRPSWKHSTLHNLYLFANQ